MQPYTLQQNFDIRCEWGIHGVERLSLSSDVVIIVDVLSFSTCVDIATARGATVMPYRYRDERATAYAREQNALLASRDRSESQYTLSPSSLMTIPDGTRLVLPSPNGATLSMSTGDTPTLTACLRNAQAVAEMAASIGKRITVIAAGERWQPDGATRFALEDWLGAGAVIHHLTGKKSFEAQAAESVYLRHHDDMFGCLRAIGSGIELIESGFDEDVRLAAQINVSQAAPRLRDSGYTS